MAKVGPALGVLFVLVGCGGKTCEEDILVLVNVTDPDGAAIPDVTVTLDELPCTDSGDGISFQCRAPEAGDYNVYALATSFEPYGKLVTVDAPEDCDVEPEPIAVQLQRESAV